MRFYEHYKKQTTQQLRVTLPSLTGQPLENHTSHERAKAIKQVLEERKTLKVVPVAQEKPSQDAPAPVNEDRGFDEIVARKYLDKMQNARERGLEFTLTLRDVARLMRRKRCYFTGIALIDTTNSTHPQKRTFDRLDSSKGYTPGNTVACSQAANASKSWILENQANPARLTPKQLLRLASAIVYR